MNPYNKYCKVSIISLLQKVKLRFRKIKIPKQVCPFSKAILFPLYY